uniref:ATP synthase complex subunit 8 n=1 Tax=Fukomys damarensis TaxID=885580 RepID=A0A0U2KQT4_FUKDA|nr:ATP synthase F0 subunit 8 [Fukomys damarensis]
MPQLDTSTWLLTILAMTVSLFIMSQLKVLTHHYFMHPQPKLTSISKHTTPWEKKWTKIYLPPSSYLQ